MPKATSPPGASLLSATDHRLLLIDLQSHMAFAIKAIAPELLRNNAALLKRAAKAFGAPSTLTTVSENSVFGPMFDAFEGGHA